MVSGLDYNGSVCRVRCAQGGRRVLPEDGFYASPLAFATMSKLILEYVKLASRGHPSLEKGV